MVLTLVMAPGKTSTWLLPDCPTATSTKPSPVKSPMPETERPNVAAAIPVDPADGSNVYCNSPRLVQQSTGREWKPVRSEIGIPYVAEERDLCDSTTTEPYQMVVAFVVPDDVSGPFWVDVTSAEETFVRFSIDP